MHGLKAMQNSIEASGVVEKSEPKYSRLQAIESSLKTYRQSYIPSSPSYYSFTPRLSQLRSEKKMVKMAPLMVNMKVEHTHIYIYIHTHINKQTHFRPREVR